MSSYRVVRCGAHNLEEHLNACIKLEHEIKDIVYMAREIDNPFAIITHREVEDAIPEQSTTTLRIRNKAKVG